ncbi:MAG: HEAT repeat domain-containing protein [Promethearchaeota archaeon]
MTDFEFSKVLIELLKTEEVKKLKECFLTLSELLDSDSEICNLFITMIQTDEFLNTLQVDSAFLKLFVNGLEGEIANNQESKICLLLKILQDEKPWLFNTIVGEFSSLIKTEPRMAFILPIVKNEDLKRELIDQFPEEGVLEPNMLHFLLGLMKDPDSWVRGRVIDLLGPIISEPDVRKEFINVIKEDEDLWIRNRARSILQGLD